MTYIYIYNIYIYTDTNPITLPCSLARAGSNRALDKFSESQYNMSFHVQKWLDIQMVGRIYQVKRWQIKKGGEKTMGGKIKKNKKKEEKNKKGRKKGEVNKTKGKKGKEGGKKIE